jgi:hypothetical protein
VELRKSRYSNSTIYLPPVAQYKINFELKLSCNQKEEAAVELIIDCGGAKVFSQIYKSKGYGKFFSDEFFWQSPDPYSGCYLSFKLLSGGNLRIAAGSVCVLEFWD